MINQSLFRCETILQHTDQIHRIGSIDFPELCYGLLHFDLGQKHLVRTQFLGFFLDHLNETFAKVGSAFFVSWVVFVYCGPKKINKQGKYINL